MSAPERVHVPLLLKAVHHVETAKLGVGELCTLLEIDPATFYRLRQTADAHLGVRFDQHDGGTLYVCDWGLLSAARARRAAQAVVNRDDR